MFWELKTMNSWFSRINDLLKGQMAFTSCILFTSETSEQNTTSKGHLALKKAIISREYDVHRIFTINVRTYMSLIFQVFIQQYEWIFHSYLICFTLIWSMELWWDQISVNGSEFFSHTFVSTDTPIFVLDLVTIVLNY